MTSRFKSQSLRRGIPVLAALSIAGVACSSDPERDDTQTGTDTGGNDVGVGDVGGTDVARDSGGTDIGPGDSGTDSSVTPDSGQTDEQAVAALIAAYDNFAQTYCEAMFACDPSFAEDYGSVSDCAAYLSDYVSEYVDGLVAEYGADCVAAYALFYDCSAQHSGCYVDEYGDFSFGLQESGDCDDEFGAVDAACE